MAQGLTIGEVSKEVGAPPSTIRYYEKEGLLQPGGRTASNYRYYHHEHVERLRFIRAAQASGLTLGDIKTLLSFRDGVTSPCEEVRELLLERLGSVEAQMKELRHVRSVLRSFLRACGAVERGEECPVIENLGVTARKRPRRKSK